MEIVLGIIAVIYLIWVLCMTIDVVKDVIGSLDAAFWGWIDRRRWYSEDWYNFWMAIRTFHNRVQGTILFIVVFAALIVFGVIVFIARRNARLV